VTGGAGFIGSHVVDRLVNARCHVRVLDDLSTGELANIGGHVRKARIDFVEGDIRDLDIVEKSLHGIDAVVHLAAMISVPLSVEQPMLAYEKNAKGTSDLLDLCVEQNVEKFIFISSCAVYGKPSYLPVDEEHPAHPLSPYAASKLIAERYCDTLREKYGLKTTILRLFNVYGPRQSLNQHGGVIAQFVSRVKQRQPLIIYGDGSQTRDFVHVSDASEAVLRALKDESAEGEVFNIGVGKPTSLNDLAKTVLSFADTDLDILYRRTRQGDVNTSFADIAKARRVLGFEPRVTLDSGLQTVFGEVEKAI
jgi:UDP-glucose 4-epimerase